MNETIVIFSDSPLSTTGFGKVTDNIVDAIIESGNTPIVVGMKSDTEPSKYKCKIIHPRSIGDNKGWDTLEIVIRKSLAKIVITIGDPWDVYPIVDLKYKMGFKWIGYNTVEAKPYARNILQSIFPRRSIDTSVIINAMDYCITCTNFGKDAISEMLATIGDKKDITTVYFGTDTEYYQADCSKKDSKAFIGLDPDVFLFSVAKTNTERSGFDVMLDAWDLFIEKLNKKEPGHRAYLYFHTDPHGVGYNLIDMVQQRGSEHVIYDESIKLAKGHTKDMVRNLYRATDVLINPTKGEGWGLTIHEAMSCGTPCIVGDYAGPAEWGADAVIKIPVSAYYQPQFAATKFAILDYKKMANEMLSLYNNSSKRDLLGRRSRDVATRYTWDSFKDEWVKVIDKAVEESAGIEISTLTWRAV